MKPTHPNEIYWSQKYRPDTINDCVLPESTKATLNAMISQGKLLSMIFDGPPGIGKTTAGLAIAKEMDAAMMMLNGAADNGIDKFRTDVTQFASTMSMFGGSQRKIVLIDEAENLSAAMMNALKTGMEDFSESTTFILTSNHREKIIEPVHSRCSLIDFRIPKAEAPAISLQIMKRAKAILEAEGIEYSKDVLRAVIMKHYPDFRRIINVLQRYSTSGKLSEEVLGFVSDEAIDRLIDIMKGKRYTDLCKWVVESSDDPHNVMKSLYTKSKDQMQGPSIPMLVAEYAQTDYKMAFVVDKDITLLHFLTNVMQAALWK